MSRTDSAAIAMRQRMRHQGHNQTSLAKAIGRSQSWVSNVLLVDPEATLTHLAYREQEVLRRLLTELGWTLPQLNAATGLDIPIAPSELDEVELVNPDLRSGTRSIPVIDLLSAGPGGDGGVVIEQIDIPDSWKGEHLAYRVSGDSMQPDIANGDTVVVRQQDYASAGNEIVAWSPEHGMLLKYLERTTPEGDYVLTSYNPEHRPIWARELIIYGVVVEVRKRRNVVNGNHGPT